MAEPNENDPPRRRDRDDDNSGDRPRRRDRDDDDFDDRPRRRRDRDGYDEPKGSNAGMVIAIIAGVFVVGVVIVGVLVALLLPAVQKVRDAAARMKDSNNLKQIGIGALNYNDTNRGLPPAEGKVSWRVHLLPYIEQEGVYRQFDLKQAWDGPTNKRLAGTRIPAYQSAGDPPETVETRYRVFVGPNTLYEPGQPPMQLADVRDGVSSTIFAVEAGELVPWPQPRELQYDRNAPLPPLGVPGRNVVQVLMLDGSVRAVSPTIDPNVLRGGIEPNDGKLFNP